MKQISLRLPDELHARLKASADASRRSLHGEILWRLAIDLDEYRITPPSISQAIVEAERQALQKHGGTPVRDRDGGPVIRHDGTPLTIEDLAQLREHYDNNSTADTMDGGTWE